MTGRRVGLLVAGAVLIGTLPVAARAAAPRFRMWRVSRTGTAAAALDMNVTVTTHGARPMAVVFAVGGRGPSRAAHFKAMYDAAAPYPIVYGVAGMTWTPCPAAPGCDSADEDITLDVDSHGKTTESYFIVTDHASSRVEVRSKGWRVREVAPTTVQRLLPEQTSATGVAAPGVSVERFTDASAPGGKHGSFAVAAVACELLGVGTARLTRVPTPVGKDEQEMRCTGQVTGQTVSASVPTRATWRVEGSIIGAGDEPTRLLVVDLPAS